MQETQVIETAEDIVVDFVFHESELRVEGVRPNYVEVLDGGSEIGIPVEMFGDQEGESDVHFNDCLIFIDNVVFGFRGEIQCGCFIPQVVNLSESFSKVHGHLVGLVHLQIFDERFYEVGGDGLFQWVMIFHGKYLNFIKNL